MVSEDPMRELQRLGQEFDASPIEDGLEAVAHAIWERYRAFNWPGHPKDDGTRVRFYFQIGIDEARILARAAIAAMPSQSQSIRVMREALARPAAPRHDAGGEAETPPIQPEE